MATGGIDPFSVDSRVTCSVCLEPYRGRQPKLLPCHHTFCLPCLQQLSDRASQPTTESPHAALADETEDKRTIICPTCRTAASVPDGGVGFFQSNFYVDDDDDGNSLASGPLNVVTPATLDESTKAMLKNAGGQIQVLEMVITQLKENEKELDLQKKAFDQELNIQYATLLGLVADARDEFLRSVRDTAQAQRDKIQEEVAAAEKTMTELSQLTSCSGSLQPSQLKTKLQAALITDADLQKYNEQMDRGSPPTFFTSTLGCNTSDLTHFLKKFFAPVTPFKEVSDHPPYDTDQGLDGAYSDCADRKPLESSIFANNAKDDGEWRTRFEDLSTKVEVLLNQHKSAQERNTREFSSMQKELAALYREAATLRDKNAILCENVGMLQAENTQLRQDVTRVQSEGKDVVLLQANITSLQRDSILLKDSCTKADQQVTAVKGKVATLELKVQDMSYQVYMLENKMNETGRQVAFHAALHTNVRTRSVRKLIYKDVEENTGDAYDSDTGVFTAPVEGTYFFMATAKPSTGDRSAELSLMTDEKNEVSYVCSDDVDNASSCHAAVHLLQGEQVWMETHDDASSFASGKENSFSGILVQADLS